MKWLDYYTTVHATIISTYIIFEDVLWMDFAMEFLGRQ